MRGKTMSNQVHDLRTAGGGKAGGTFRGLQDNNYGNGLPVPAGQGDTLLLRAHGADDEPATIAITAGYRLLPPFGPAEVVPVLTLVYGTGGSIREVEMDLLTDMIFNVTATSFDLRVRNPAPVEDPNNFGGNDIFAQASFGMGAAGRSSQNPARRTIRVGTLVAGGSSLIAVPQGATSFNVFTASPAPVLGNLQVSQLLDDSNLSPVLSVSQSATLDVGYGAIPLVGGARGLSVFNANPGDAVGVRVMFTLVF
jgi:hypothetical protein